MMAAHYVFAAMILVIHAHPYPSRSRATHALLEAARALPNVEAHSLYDRYPDFDIDVAFEQEALSRADLVMWLHPIYWYSEPALMKLWFEKVLAFRWAFGPSGNALRGKHCLWAATTGGDDAAYDGNGIHHASFNAFHAPIEQTARFCGMTWLPPFIVHGAHSIDDAALQSRAQSLVSALRPFTHTKEASA
jgi:glutathione-regulated potassium-efflux system ancillary protein KefF